MSPNEKNDCHMNAVAKFIEATTDIFHTHFLFLLSFSVSVCLSLEFFVPVALFL